MKHNNVIPNAHFRKHWQRRVKTWFDQPARKYRRRQRRIAKAKALFPRPLKKLRPIVRGQGIRYNTHERLGRGFTPAEIKAAGLTPYLARSIGIMMDRRRKNRSMEAFQSNVDRLKVYQSKLVLFPRVAAAAAETSEGGSAPKKQKIQRKPTPLDASEEEMANAVQFTGAKIMPIVKAKAQVPFVKITSEMQSFGAWNKLQEERKRAKEAGKTQEEKE